MTIPWLMNCGHSDDGWCLECVKSLGEERAELLAALVRLADAAEAMESSDPDMPSHEDTVRDFDEALDEARTAINAATGEDQP